MVQVFLWRILFPAKLLVEWHSNIPGSVASLVTVVWTILPAFWGKKDIWQNKISCMHFICTNLAFGLLSFFTWSQMVRSPSEWREFPSNNFVRKKEYIPVKRCLLCSNFPNALLKCFLLTFRTSSFGISLQNQKPFCFCWSVEKGRRINPQNRSARGNIIWCLFFCFSVLRTKNNLSSGSFVDLSLFVSGTFPFFIRSKKVMFIFHRTKGKEMKIFLLDFCLCKVLKGMLESLWFLLKLHTGK